jgi:hypothetical protein
LKVQTPKKLTAKELEAFENAASEILDHFEVVGTLLDRGVLDKYLVSTNYFYWVYRYWTCLNEVVIKYRQDDATTWEDAELLYNLLCKWEKRYKSRVFPTLTQAELTSFYKYESSLV